ncbi:MFS transporter [Streptomyces sp. NPDC058470]|uniref:MFS transporter n=1 Tax=Streptomyces sp. NPDC058470 TaxID=3346515 RepID=UPI00364948B2
MVSISTSQFGISVVYGAVPGVLLALQVQDLVGDDRKAGVLSLFTLLGAAAAMVAQPLAGALSDRTRTRSGSRTPFIVGGSVLAVPFLWGMGGAGSLATLAVLYVASEFVLSAAQGPLAAVLPDRVPVERRGRFSSALSLGMMLGSVGGTVLGSVISADYGVAYLVLGLIPVALAGTRLFIAPDPDNRSGARVRPGPTRTRGWRSFLVSPKEHPDFWWAFAGRTLTYTGFFLVQAYGLYLLDDYIGLGDDAVDVVPVVAGVAALCICLSVVPAGIVSDRIGRRKVFVACAATALGGAMLIPLISPTVTGYLLMTALGSLAFGCFEAVDTALITQVLPRSASYAQDLGVVNFASTAPQILAPAVAGAIVVSTDSYALIFPTAAVLGLLGGLAVLRVKSVR